MTLSTTPFRLAALAALAFTAHAASFVLTESGTFDSTSSLGGTAFGADQSFTFTATFNGDPAANRSSDPFAAIYPISAFSITLPGHGTYTGVTGVTLNAYFGLGGDMGLSDRVGANLFVANFSGGTPTFDPRAVGPTTFTGYNTIGSANGYFIALVGVSGGLTINGLGSGNFTASVTAVPEPGEYAAVAGLALGAFALVRRGRRGSAN